jgi:hypothetical protein
LRSGETARPAIAGNTTLGVIATNATLSKAQATKVAQMAQDGFARTIVPAHTPGDGDTIFALATGERSGEANVSRIGALPRDDVAGFSGGPEGGLPGSDALPLGGDSGLFRRSIRTSRARPNTVVVCELHRPPSSRCPSSFFSGQRLRSVARTMLPCAPRRLGMSST